MEYLDQVRISSTPKSQRSGGKGKWNGTGSTQEESIRKNEKFAGSGSESCRMWFGA
jgi:hypothetical protein